MLKITERMVKQLSRTNLALEDRIALVNSIQDKLHILPIGEMIVLDPQGGIMINGRQLDQGASISFKEAISILKENFARKIIHEQIRYKAIDMGINKSLSIDTLMFSKAAIWIINEYEILLEKLQKIEGSVL